MEPSGTMENSSIVNKKITIAGTKTNKYEKSFEIYDCRRNGISIAYGKNITVQNVSIHDINDSRDWFSTYREFKDYGYKKKESGIDIEPGKIVTQGNAVISDSALPVQAVIIKNNIMYNTKSGNIRSTSGSLKIANKVKNVTVKNNYLDTDIWCSPNREGQKLIYLGKPKWFSLKATKAYKTVKNNTLISVEDGDINKIKIEGKAELIQYTKGPDDD